MNRRKSRFDRRRRTASRFMRSSFAQQLRVEQLEDRRMLAIIVDTLADVVDITDGVTSLREAIVTANLGGPNLLQNHSFDQTPINGTSTPHWNLTVNQPDGNDPSAQFRAAPWSSSTRRPGDYGLWFRSFEGEQDPGDDSANALLTQTVVAGSGDYRLSFWAKHETFVQATAMTVSLEFVGSGTQPVETFDLLTMTPANGSGPDGWDQYHLLGTAPAGTTSIVVSAEMIEGVDALTNPQSMFVDDFQLRVRDEANTITFDPSLSGGTIKLSGTELVVTNSVVIDASNLEEGITIDASQQSRVLNVSAASGDLTLNNLTVTGGRPSTYNGSGGGILFNSDGTLSLTDTAVKGNSVTGPTARGGGIFTPSGSVIVTNSTVSGNSASDKGGGIFNATGSVTFTNSTLSGNTANDDGGGLWIDDAPVIIGNSTITNNTAGNVGGGIGMLADNFAFESLTLENSIIAGNTDNGTAPDFLAPGDPANDLVVNYSLIGDTTGTAMNGSMGTGNVVDVDPLLAPLGDYGGPTQTHALLAGSPAIDAGDPIFDPLDPDSDPLTDDAILYDQRGEFYQRVDDGNGDFASSIDMGAFEVPFTYVVDTRVDESDGNIDPGDFSLREAIELANSSAPNATNIIFDPTVFTEANHTITLNIGLGELVVAENVSIDATSTPSGVMIDADGNSRVINVDPSNALTAGNILLVGLTLTGGNTTGDGGAILASDESLNLIESHVTGNTSGDDGGGIYILTGNVTMTHSTVNNNTASGGRGYGGGILIRNGTITLSNSSVSGNMAFGFRPDGGGIFSYHGAVALSNSTISNNRGNAGGGIHSRGGLVSLVDSTVSGNRAETSGGGILSSGMVSVTSSTISGNQAENSGAINASREIYLRNSTIFGNSADSYGGITQFVQTVNGIDEFIYVENSIVAGNSATNPGTNADIRQSNGESVTINHSLIGNADGLTINGTNNQTGTTASPVDPMLTPLAYNGGTTQTHALLPGSPAIDAGGTTELSNDQRGVPFLRDDGNGIDIGAYERQSIFPILEVDTTADENDGDYSVGDLSLREAIGLANGSIGLDTISFANALIDSPQTINISSQLPTITGDLDIFGPGADLLTINAGDGADNTFNTGDGYRIFNIDDVDNSNEVFVTIDGLTLTGGDVSAPDGDGGAIRNQENLIVTNSTIDSNASFSGGGIFNGGTLNVNESTISGNSARGGGALTNFAGVLNLTNSTLSGNFATIYDGGGISNFAGLTVIESSTITGNSAAQGIGSGVASYHNTGPHAATTQVSSSIIAGNVNADIVVVGGSTNSFVSNGFNLVGTDFGIALAAFAAIGDQTGVTDPMLGPLAYNGGPTMTHALLSGSPALDAGNSFEAFDQRGANRVVDLPGVANTAGGNGADIGAFEQQLPPPVVTSLVRDGGGVLERPDLLTTLAVTFDADVNIEADDLILRNDTLGGAVVDTSLLTFDYNSSNQTATWTFGSLILDPAFYSLELSENITSVTGNVGLDGDSDGNAGGSFEDLIYLAIPGDANLDGQVNVLGDAFLLVGNLGTTGGATWAQGDFNDDGNVNVLGDAFILVGRLGQSVLPPQMATLSGSEATTDSRSMTEGELTPVERYAFVPSPTSVHSFEQDDDRNVDELLKPSKAKVLAGSQTLDAAFAVEDLLDGLF